MCDKIHARTWHENVGTGKYVSFTSIIPKLGYDWLEWITPEVSTV